MLDSTRLRKTAAVILTAGVLACSGLLDVRVPGNIPEAQLEDPAFADVLTRSVVAQFECSLAEHAGAQGLLGSEMRQSGNLAGRDHFHNRIHGNLQGTSNCGGGSTVFGTSGAQVIAMAFGRDVTRKYQDRTDAEQPNRLRHLATTTVYTAFATSVFGQGYCTAVFEPNGPEQTPAQMLATAETWFTDGLTLATALADNTLIRLARLGRARVRLYRGDKAGAIADAQTIPTGFVVNATRSATPLTRNNRIFAEAWRDRHVTIHPSFYNLGINPANGGYLLTTAGGTADPRVRVQNMNAKGTDGVTDAWYPLKADGAEDPIRMASWDEAQLIIAEASVGTDNAAALAAVNAARAAKSPAIRTYVPTNINDNTEMLNLVLEERRRELFLEGFWVADAIRHAASGIWVWDEGLNHQGQSTYRAQYCVPLSDRERQYNPNI